MDENSNNIKIGLISLAGCLPFFLGIFSIFIAVFLVLGLFDSDGNSNNNSHVYIDPSYSYSDSINVDGKLYSLDDYVAGVVANEAYTSEGAEALKAQAIAARTFVLYHSDGGKKAVINSTAFQTFNPNPNEQARKAAEDTSGLVMIYDNNLFSSMYDSFCYEDNDCPDAIKNEDGTYSVTYTKKPNGEKHKITLSDEAQYNRIPPGQGHANGMSRLLSYQLAKEGKSYEEILKYFYSPGIKIVSLSTIGNGTENNESGVGYTSTYTNTKNGQTYPNYKQFAFGVDWIKSYGCGLTSTSIVISGINKEITPPYLYRNYRVPDGSVSLNKYLNIYMPDKNKYIGNTVKNRKEDLKEHLKNGGTAIFFIQKERGCYIINGVSWTNWQHFFAVLDYNEYDNTIYISNPGSNNQAQNGWISLDAFDCAEISFFVY